MTNGVFSDVSGWTLSNCIISGDAMDFGNAGTLMFGSQPAASLLFAGAVYEATFDLTAISGSGVSPYVGGTQGDTFNTTGAKTSYIASSVSNQTIGVISRGANNFIGSIDNLSIKKVAAGYMPDFPILPQAEFAAESVCAADIVMAAAPEWLAGAEPFAGMSVLVAVSLS